MALRCRLCRRERTFGGERSISANSEKWTLSETQRDLSASGQSVYLRRVARL